MTSCSWRHDMATAALQNKGQLSNSHNCSAGQRNDLVQLKTWNNASSPDNVTLSVCKLNVYGEVGGWGRDPQKCTGRDWGMGSSTISWKLCPVVKYHLRRGVGFMKFLENGSRPQPPTSLSMRYTVQFKGQLHMWHRYDMRHRHDRIP